MLNGLDLFSGIGGITRALDGYVKPVAYCEIDPYARGVLLSRMFSGDIPDAPIWDDVSSLRGAMLPSIDIIYGGFPCQDISVAGRGAGLEGKRSGLFSEICRLAGETEAEWLFLENVPNIRTKGLGTVLQALAELGYDTRYGMLSAADVGANHKRQRWFLLAHTHDKGPERRNGEKLQECSSKQPTWTSDSSTNVANTTGEQSRGIRLAKIYKDSSSAGDRRGQASWWAVEPDVGRVAYGIPKRVDRLRALGNAVVPTQAREAFERLIGLKECRV